MAEKQKKRKGAGAEAADAAAPAAPAAAAEEQPKKKKHKEKHAKAEAPVDAEAAAGADADADAAAAKEKEKSKKKQKKAAAAAAAAADAEEPAAAAAAAPAAAAPAKGKKAAAAAGRPAVFADADGDDSAEKAAPKPAAAKPAPKGKAAAAAAGTPAKAAAKADAKKPEAKGKAADKKSPAAAPAAAAAAADKHVDLELDTPPACDSCGDAWESADPARTLHNCGVCLEAGICSVGCATLHFRTKKCIDKGQEPAVVARRKRWRETQRRRGVDEFETPLERAERVKREAAAKVAERKKHPLTDEEKAAAEALKAERAAQRAAKAEAKAEKEAERASKRQEKAEAKKEQKLKEKKEKKEKKSAAGEVDANGEPKHYKKGAFSHAESKALTEAIEAYLAKHGLEEDFIQKLCAAGARKSKELPEELKKPWSEIAEALPDRSKTAIYQHARRKYGAETTGRFTKAEVEELKTLHAHMGNDWVGIAKKLGRNPDTVRLKVEALTGAETAKRGRWTTAEDEKLVQIVCAGDKLPTRDVSWKAVAIKMGSRDATQCRIRWFRYLFPRVARREPYTHEWSGLDDRKLIRALHDSGAQDESEVAWRDVALGWPTDWIRMRWKKLQRIADSYPEGTFATYVEQLFARINREAKDLYISDATHAKGAAEEKAAADAGAAAGAADGDGSDADADMGAGAAGAAGADGAADADAAAAADAEMEAVDEVDTRKTKGQRKAAEAKEKAEKAKAKAEAAAAAAKSAAAKAAAAKAAPVAAASSSAAAKAKPAAPAASPAKAKPVAAAAGAAVAKPAAAAASPAKKPAASAAAAPAPAPGKPKAKAK